MTNLSLPQNIIFSWSNLGQLNDQEEIFYSLLITGEVISSDGSEIPESIKEYGLEKVKYIKEKFNLEEIPNNLKRKSTHIRGVGHMDIYYTHWGYNPPKNSIVTFDGNKELKKAWIEI